MRTSAPASPHNHSTNRNRAPVQEQGRREDGAPSGWDQYIALLERERVPSSARRWYVRRAQDFIDAMRPKRLSSLSAEEIIGFFPRYPREQRLTDWQYRQTVDAVQGLLGHKDVSTTMIYTHVLERPGVPPVRSPVDTL